MSNAFAELKRLLPDPKLAIATVDTIHGDGTATVTYPGGQKERVRTSASLGGPSAGDRAFVRSGVIEGEAPALSSSSISAG